MTLTEVTIKKIIKSDKGIILYNRFNMKYFSMFSGIGGFEKGIEDAEESIKSNGQQQKDTTLARSGDSKFPEVTKSIKPTLRGNDTNWECIGYSEIDRYASSIFKYHYPSIKNYGDATKLVPEELPDFDCIVGGFPCQSFSIAGKREAFSDIRGTLFFEICRIARVKKPSYLFLENVKGLLSAPYTEDVETWDEEDFDENGKLTSTAKRKHKVIAGTKGWVFLTILNTLWELGYDCQWQVLNSRFHGVPQNRERVFIIGHLGGVSQPKIFPIGENGQGIREALGKASRSGKRIWNEHNQSARSLRVGDSGMQENLVASTISQRYGKDGSECLIHIAYPDGAREYKEIAPTISTPSGGGHLPYVAQALQTDGQLRQGVSWDTDKPQSTRNIRRLTPIECERLQGFPDNWTKYGLDKDGEQIEISDSQRYKCLGNAVTVSVIKDIVTRWQEANK